MREALNLRAGRDVFEILLQHHCLAVRADEVYLESADLHKKKRKREREEKKRKKERWGEVN